VSGALALLGRPADVDGVTVDDLGGFLVRHDDGRLLCDTTIEPGSGGSVELGSCDGINLEAPELGRRDGGRRRRTRDWE
jgi:hypothetical protein